MQPRSIRDLTTTTAAAAASQQQHNNLHGTSQCMFLSISILSCIDTYACAWSAASELPMKANTQPTSNGRRYDRQRLALLTCKN